MRRLWWVILLVFLLFSQVTFAQTSERPRLWITPTSLEQYRSWATDSNPFWSEILLPLVERAKEEMDNGDIANDTGGNAYEDYATENYAVLFAFVSLIHPDEAQRADYAERSRTLLMVVMNEAVKGVAEGEPFRSAEFSTADRSRWYGVSFPLTVDWIYPTLSAEDKATIRTVFLRWMSELEVAATTNFNHPEPVGVVNDPILVSNEEAVRWSGNNYYTAHMRNMGMMALSFDPADDPNGELTAYLTQATGAWLYVNDYLMRTDAAGGFGTEGFEYSPQSLGYVAQFLLALHTAGADDPTVYGQQVLFSGNPFWDDSLKAYVHSLSPNTVLNPDYNQPVFEPAWYGSGQNYLTPDFIELFGAMGIYDALTNNAERLNALRWVQTHTLMGGEALLLDRSNDASEFFKTLLYFMLFDPNASPATDPRPNYPLTWYAPGMRRLLARTDWTPNGAWLTYALTWDRVDHQAGNGNALEFYYNGEWMTKIRVGYDLDYVTSDNMNTLTVQNDDIDRDDFRLMIQQRGSQWLYSANNPPQPIYSDNANYLFIYGDSTPLYNTDYEGLNGVTHVSRSIVWLKPNVVVVYDRATTNRTDSQKRFILNLTNNAVVDGNTTTMTTNNGQTFVITSLSPADHTRTVFEIPDEVSSSPAHYETIRYRYEEQVTTQDTHFFHVLQAVDNGGTPLSVISVTTADERYDVAVVNNTAVAFPRVVGQAVETLSYGVPSATKTHLISGLVPNTGYDLAVSDDGTTATVTLTVGSTYTSDSAGLLTVTLP